MDASPISRRAVLARGLRFGSAAALAALVGCTVEASTTSEAPPPPTPLATPAAPIATTAATATPYVREVRLNLVPEAMRIPSLGIDAPVAPAEVLAGTGGASEIVVPTSGIVSPNHLLGDESINNVWILGHSRWHRVPQLLYTLADRLVLADTETTARRVYDGVPAVPRLIIQTSARQAYDPEWILDRGAILAKAEVDLAGDMDDLTRYLLLLVVARLREDSLAMLLRSA